MGLYRTDYIIYGYKLPFEIKNKKGLINLWDNKFLPFIEGHKGENFILLRDYNNNAFGLKLATANQNVGWDFFHLDFKNLDAEMVKNKYRDVFELEDDEALAEPYLFILSNFA